MKKCEIDNELITKTTKGDLAAREKLAGICLERVWRTVFLATGGSSETEDLVQTAVVQAFLDLAGFKGEGRFTAWLDKVTINVVQSYYRPKKRRAFLPVGDEVGSWPDLGGCSSDRALEYRRALSAIASHVARIKPKNRTPLVLSLVQGYTVAEIAFFVGCSVEAAKKRLQRARGELMAALRKDAACIQILEELGRNDW